MWQWIIYSFYHMFCIICLQNGRIHTTILNCIICLINIKKKNIILPYWSKVRMPIIWKSLFKIQHIRCYRLRCCDGPSLKSAKLRCISGVVWNTTQYTYHTIFLGHHQLAYGNLWLYFSADIKLWGLRELPLWQLSVRSSVMSLL